MKENTSTKRRSRSTHLSHRKRRRSHSPVPERPLPLHASHLSKHDYTTYKPMFSLYLEIQKQLILEDLTDIEARGRWKSFVSKWNCGELAEGWYDPATLRKAIESSATTLPSIRDSQDYGEVHQKSGKERESSDDEEIGPALPGSDRRDTKQSYRSGPTVPSLQDLELRRELAAEDSVNAREDLRHERTLNRKREKERLEELAPRAAAGSKERMLEKKKEKAATNREFAAAKTEADGVVEVPESELLGDDDGGIEGFKKQKQAMERKKNEREIRREEVLRARADEREERFKQYRAKEEATMKGLVELAKARFG